MSKGFYITLATMIIVFGTAAVVRKLTGGVVINQSSFDETAWKEAVESAKAEEEPLLEDVEEVYYDSVVTEPELPVMSEPTVAVSRELSFEEAVEKLGMKLPDDGKILREHSPDKHVYYETMADWRTHNGIDIASDEGAVVCASADGVVEKVYEDNKLGIVVEIGHEGNIKTRYANLSDLNYIEVGRKVAKGDTIGSVGKSSVIEGKEKPHIHFEILRNDESVNPLEFIPK